jgi:hypothetical protein
MGMRFALTEENADRLREKNQMRILAIRSACQESHTSWDCFPTSICSRLASRAFHSRGAEQWPFEIL